MAQIVAASASVPAVAPRKPSKLIADLAAAMRSTAEVAREQALSQVQVDARGVVEQIRAQSTDGAAALRQRSDEDIAGIREWSKAEIARIREETDRRVTERKATLEDEIAGHAQAIERRIEQVNGTVATTTEMAEFFERLLQEEDPTRLATMAESMPEPPTFELWDEDDDLVLDSPGSALAVEAAEPEIEAYDAAPVAGVADTVPTPMDAGAAKLEMVEPQAAVAVETADVEVAAEAVEAEVAVEPEAEYTTAYEAEPEAGAEVATEPVAEYTTVDEAEPEAGAATGDAWAGTTWGDSEGAWRASPSTQVAADDETASLMPGAEGARWADSDAGAGTNAGGDLVDRGSIMAALEAAAEAVVAAEAAAESADQAEAAADVAETAAELIVGRVDSDDSDDAELDSESAFAARLDAGGFETEPSLADRLASLLPGGGAATADATPTTTQVIVTGLVSVASIASFKRHLGRLHGVQSVSVASGPDGEFMFTVTHRADATFRDAIPTLPGFGARITGTGDGVVHVTARDPETEG
jgi:hypothetical protein